MNFIDAVLAIKYHPGYDLCDDENEKSGKHPSICVYRGGNFIGKLRWKNCEVDLDQEYIEELESFLKLLDENNAYQHGLPQMKWEHGKEGNISYIKRQ